MSNFKNKDGIAILRNGNSLFCSTTGNYAIDVTSYPKGTPELFMVVTSGVNTIWKDITSGVASTVRTIGGSVSFTFPLFFKNYLMYFGNGDLLPTNTGPQYYDGTTWGTLTYTWPASFQPYGGTVFKNRAYFIKKDASSYGYTEIDSVSGAVTQVDLDGIVSEKSFLYIIRSISATEAVSPENVLAFIHSSGEVLVYSGAYPNSATWGIVSRFQISKPIYYQSFVDAKGDSFILTESEILSLRNLFYGGYDQERATGIGAAIQPRWQQIFQGLYNSSSVTPYLIEGVYDKVNDRLVISLPSYVNPNTGVIVANTSFQLIYDFKLGAWYEYVQTTSATLTKVTTICYHANQVYFSCYDGTNCLAYKIEGSTQFADDQIDGSGVDPIDFQLQLAALSIPKFGVIEVEGVEVIVKSDLYAQTNYKLIGDFGRQTTSGQTLEDQGASIARPMANVGLTNSLYVQVDISGSTVSGKTIGLELYAFNVWYNEGLRGSR